MKRLGSRVPSEGDAVVVHGVRDSVLTLCKFVCRTGLFSKSEKMLKEQSCPC